MDTNSSFSSPAKEKKEYYEALEAYRTLSQAINTARIRVERLTKIIFLTFSFLLIWIISLISSYTFSSIFNVQIDSKTLIGSIFGSTLGGGLFYIFYLNKEREVRYLQKEIGIATQTLEQLEKELFGEELTSHKNNYRYY